MKNKKGLFWIVGIIVVLLCFCVIFKDRIFSVKEKKEIEEVAEEKITDETLKNDLATKIKYITLSEDNYVNSYSFRNGGVYGDIFHDFNDTLKLQIVLDYLYKEEKFIALKNENLSNAVIQDTIKNFGTKEIKEISGTEVKNAYLLFFGEEVKELKSIDGCFGYTYDDKTSTYFKMSSTCGGTSSSYVYSYNNKYTTKKDEAYVYVNYGLGTFTDDNNTSYNLYKDLNSEVLYRGNITDIPYYEFKIDKSNYFDFSEYKFTFKKDLDDNYYFVSFSQIS